MMAAELKRLAKRNTQPVSRPATQQQLVMPGQGLAQYKFCLYFWQERVPVTGFRSIACSAVSFYPVSATTISISFKRSWFYSWHHWRIFSATPVTEDRKTIENSCKDVADSMTL